MGRWGVRLCTSCGHELSADGGTRWSSPGVREVSWRCGSCGTRFKSVEDAFDPRYHAAWEWGADDQGRPFLEVDVEGWPIATRLVVQHLEKAGPHAPWQAVTPDGERLDRLKAENGGPVDRLVVDLFNRHLAALNRGERDDAPPRAEITLGSKVPQVVWKWQPFGYGLHLLSLWADGWPVQVDARLTGIQRDPESGDWHAVTHDGQRLEEVDETLPGTIGDVVTGLFNQRLAFLRDNDAALTQRKPRSG